MSALVETIAALSFRVFSRPARLMQFSVHLLLMGLVLQLAGCANTFNKQFYDPQPTRLTDLREIKNPPPGMASVYLIKEKVALQDFSYVPIAAVVVAIDDKIISFLPHGAFAHLFLEAKTYKFSQFTEGSLKQFDSKEINLEAGRVYFISIQKMHSLFNQKITILDNKEGEDYVKIYDLARTIHSPQTLGEFNAFAKAKKQKEIRDSEATSIEKKNPAPASNPIKETNTAVRTQATLAPAPAPSRSSTSTNSTFNSNSVSDLFATVAAVAVIALFIFAVGLGMSANQDYINHNNHILDNEPQHQPFYSQPVKINSVRSSSGHTLNIESSTSEYTLKNVTTGVRYKVDGNRINGSDGSSFKVYGSTLYSSDGNYYTKEGNSLYSNDGRKCQIVGSQIMCN